METRPTSLHGRVRRLLPRSRPLRGFAAWAELAESSQSELGATVTHIVATSKRKSSKPRKAAVTAKLRDMVQDVERWPLSDQLLRALEELEDGPEGDDPPPASTAARRRS